MPALRGSKRPVPTIALFEPLRLVRIACAHWPQLDGDELCALLPAGAARDADLERQIPLSSVFDILALIARRVKQADVPLVLAAGTQLDEMGLVGFAIMTSATGREAVARAIRFQRLISAAGSWHAENGESQVTLTWLRSMPLDLGHRLANEIVLAQFVHYARQLLGPLEPASVHFRHAAPAQTKSHREHFGCAVHFGAEHDQLVLPCALLDRKPVSANRALSEYFHTLVERRVEELPGESVRTQVRAWAATRLLDGEPDPETVARKLGMSLRTLQTRLREEGCSFREVVDALRREQALVLLDRGESVTSTAFALGFSETSAFSRAFRRWYGHPPRQALSAR